MKPSTVVLFAFTLLGLTTKTLQAQIGINNTAANPDASAILDLNTGNAGVNKGFLAPHVALTNVTVAAPVTSPATGLIVYSSTAPTGGNGTGYYYWNGTAWASLNSTTGGSGTNNYIARWTPNGNTLGTGIIRDNGSSVGINGAPSNAMLYVNSTRAAGDSAIGATYGVYGYTPPGNIFGAGVYGRNIDNYGVEGVGNVGVSGIGGIYGGYFTTAAGQGVYSTSLSAAGDSSIGKTYGVYGKGTSMGGYFVATAGWGVDVSGTIEGGNFTGSAGPGVYVTGTYAGGEFFASSGQGVYGQGTLNGGFFQATAGQGVYTTSLSAAGDSSVGITYGGYFMASSGDGVYAKGTTEGGNFIATNGKGIDVQGTTVGGAFYATAGQGVYASGTTEGGNFTATAGKGVDVLGTTVGGAFYATAGQGVYASGTTEGGEFTASAGQGVYSNSSSAAGDSSTGKTYGVYGSGKIGAEFTGTQYGLLVTNGNVGIGCTTPFYTLDVNGNIRASGSVYYGGNACSNAGTAYTKPDYVFEPDYKKTYTPFEIEQFIIANGHLPWVTSAVDEKKENNGAVDITRMSFQTLEAVENTQMQIIEQQKLMEKQNTTIDELKIENELLKQKLAELTISVTQLLNEQKSINK